VRTLQRVVAGHERNLGDHRRRRSTLLVRKSRYEQALTDAVAGMAELGLVYVPQLFAAETETKRRGRTANSRDPR